MESTPLTVPPETYFAPAARAGRQEMEQVLATLNQNPLVDMFLKMANGLVAVLNVQRQILAVNLALLEALGVSDGAQVLGLRPGEALDCIHAHDCPGGCGTSQVCATCGAVIAMVTCLAHDLPEQRDCLMTVEKGGLRQDLYFQVRCNPLSLGGQRFLLLFLRDIPVDQQRATLERVFFHDLNNLINVLLANSEMLTWQEDTAWQREVASRIMTASTILAQEVAIQRALSCTEPQAYTLALKDFPVADIMDGLRTLLANHPAAAGKTLDLPAPVANLRLKTDPALLQRILINMLVNAFEATEAGGRVRLWLEAVDGAVTFGVWNRRPIPEGVTPRIFQRNFSTKPGSGRGLGTYSMKLFGETYLHGQVNFTTSATEGTTFRLRLPADGQALQSPPQPPAAQRSTASWS